MGPRMFTLFFTRAVLLTALCGMALNIVGSMSVHRQQYFDAWSCGEQVWDVSFEGRDGIWAAVENVVREHELTAMVSGADPSLKHVAGQAGSCLTGADASTIASLRAEGGFLLRGEGALAARVLREGDLQDRPSVVVPSSQWRGLSYDSAIQPAPAIDRSTSYVGFVVGPTKGVETGLQALTDAGVLVTDSPAAVPWNAAVRNPLLGVTGMLTALTGVSVTAFWALTLRAHERTRIRVLRLIGVPPATAAVARWPVSAVPFSGAAVTALIIWLGMLATGGLPAVDAPMALSVIAGVAAADGAAVALTHMAALWMRRVV